MNRIEYAAYAFTYTANGEISIEIPIYYKHDRQFFPALVLAFEAIEFEKQNGYQEFVIHQVIDGMIDREVYYYCPKYQGII